MSMPGMSMPPQGMGMGIGMGISIFQRESLKSLYMSMSGPLSMGMVSKNKPGINVAERRLFSIIFSPSVRALTENSSPRELIGTNSMWCMSMPSCMSGMSIAIAGSAAGMAIVIGFAARVNATGCSCGTCGWFAAAGGAASRTECPEVA